MGTTLWVLRKARRQEGDDYDHSAFYDASDPLDDLADELNVRRLSEFVDWADFQFNTSEESLPESWIEENARWHAPSDALPALRAILNRLRNGDVVGIEPDRRSMLIEELEDCLGKVEVAQSEGDSFQFCIVM